MTGLPRWVSSCVGVNPLSASTARPLLGRSATWPTEARTSNPLPRNLEIVFAFAGDSTMTSGGAIALLVKACEGPLSSRLGGLTANSRDCHVTYPRRHDAQTRVEAPS